MTAPSPRGLRPEIQLLRAAAVLGVVGNHLAPGLVRGGYEGVDIFFVISGFLISSHLLKELDGSGRVGLARFWARRARRLLPASLLVLAFSTVVSLLVVPMTLWSLIVRQVVASALYVQNWALALDAENYFASHNSASPVTHYWSLSVEEQFYLLWPVLAWAAFALGRRLRRPRAGLFVAFAVVVVASLAWSVWATAVRPNAAYFETPARMWQLGIGGLMAFAPALVRGRHLVAAAGWGLVVGSELLFTEHLAVPGWIALLPVLGAAGVIWAAGAFVTRPARALLPLLAAGVWIGGISYSLYLWHWPLIVLTPYATGERLTPVTKLVLLAASILLAWACARLVEDPIRRMPRLVNGPVWRTLVPAGVGMVAVVTSAMAVPGHVDDRLDHAIGLVRRAEAAGGPCFAAAAMVHDCAHPFRLMSPDLTLINQTDNRDTSPSWGHGCMQSPQGSAVVTCEFGVPRSRALHRVALVGDSHSLHWMPALDRIAVQRRWNVVMMAKSTCPVSGDTRVQSMWVSTYAGVCRQWLAGMRERLEHDPSIDMVVTSGLAREFAVPGLAKDRQLDAVARGFLTLWRHWRSLGKTVVVIGDVPNSKVGNVPECVARNLGTPDPCSTPRRVALAPDPLLVAARSAHDRGIVPIDLSRYFCGPRRCHAVIGGVIVYGDENHMLPFFARSLAPYLEQQLAARLGKA